MKTFEEAFNIAAQWEVDNHCGPAALVARALYRHLRDAALLPQPKEAIPADCDVRKIMLRVDPGPDGEGVEVYARNVGEVETLLSELGDKEEEAYASQLALPVGPLERIRKALRGRNFNDFPGDDAELLESAANVIAEDGIVLRAPPAGPVLAAGNDDMVQVQHGHLAAACYALRHPERNNETILAKLRDAARSPAVAQPVADGTFVQPVPDHCDRITWRNRYYHLPPAAEANKLDDEALYKALATIRACDLSGFPGDVIAMVDAALAAKGGAS